MFSCKLRVLIVIYLATTNSVWAQSHGVLSQEAMDLRTMLNAALEQNRQLHVQNDRLKVIWSGIENMCTAITPNFKCQCDKGKTDKTNPLLEHALAGPNSIAFKKIRALPPPSVEFYRHDNGKLVNSANFNQVKDKKPAKSVPPSTHKNPVYTVSLSPIADVLKDLNIAPYVDNTLDRKSPATTTPMPIKSRDHHIGLDLMHEMLGSHSHQNPPINTKGTGNSTIMAILLEPLTEPTNKGHAPWTRPDVKGHAHAHTSQGKHSHAQSNAHTKTAAVTENHKHFDLFNEVNGSPLTKDNGHTHTHKNLRKDQGMPIVDHKVGPQSNLDLMSGVTGDLFGPQASLDLMGNVIGNPMDPLNEVSGNLMDPTHLHGNLMEPAHSHGNVMDKAHSHVNLMDNTHSHGNLMDQAHGHGHPGQTDKSHGHKPKAVKSNKPHSHKKAGGINSASTHNHKHAQEFVLAPNNLSTKLILNDLLAATERSIHKKQMTGGMKPPKASANTHKKATTPVDPKSMLPNEAGIIEKLMFGARPMVPEQALDSIPKKNEVHQRQTTKTRKKIHTKTIANEIAANIPTKNEPKTSVVTQPTTTPRMVKKVKLAIKAVSSEGLVANAISVTVRYTAPLDHTTEWLQLQDNGATTRTSGVRTHIPGTQDTEYSSNMVFVHANATRHALFRLFGNNKSISIQFNLTELHLSGEQLLPDFMDDIVDFNETVMAERNTDLVIVLEVRGSLSENPALSHTEVFFTGLNTTTRPPSVFEIVHFNSEGVSVQLTPRTHSTSSMKVTLRPPYIDYGGILTVRLPQTVGGYLAGYYYGHMIRVLEFYTREVIPFGNLGVYYLPKSTIVREPSQSILCAAMGNPPPDVVILKVAPDGKERETLTETIMLDTVTNMKSLTLYADKPKASEGRYICRASIGSEVVNSTTEVVVVQPPEFDDIQTGVTSNTSGRVTISCKATGRPRPDLEMRLYEEHGPNLAKTGIYKTSLLTPNNSTAQLTLTVSPNDREIHTVVCVAKQNIPDSKEHYKHVVVFPKSEDYTNWYLYNRLQSMATGW